MLVLNRKKLFESVTRVYSIVERRNIIKLLDHIRITLKEGRITFTGSDLDIIVEDSFKIDYTGFLDFTLEAQPLYELLRRLNHLDLVRFNLVGIPNGQIEILGGTSTVSLPCLDGKFFPKPGEEIEENYTLCNLTAFDLRRVLLKTKHAMATGDLRYYLNGIHLTTTPEKVLIAVATDVHRLAISSLDHDFDFLLPDDIIIPKKTVNEILKLIDSLKDEEPIQLLISTNRLSLLLQDSRLTSKLVRSKYPQYSSLFEIPSNKHFSIDLRDLTKAVELVSVIASGKVKIITMTFTKTNLIVSIDNSKEGKGSKANQVLEVDSNLIEEENFTILLNARYLMDVLQISYGPRMIFKLSDNKGPLIVKDTADQSSSFVLMPMQLEGIS